MKRYGMIDVEGLNAFKADVAARLNALEALKDAIIYPPHYPSQALCIEFVPHHVTRTLPSPDYFDFDGWEDVDDLTYGSADNAYKFAWIAWRVQQMDTCIGLMEALRDHTEDFDDATFFVPFGTGETDFDRGEFRPGSYDAEARREVQGQIFVPSILIDNLETAALALWGGSPDFEPALDHHLEVTEHYVISGDPFELEYNDLNLEDGIWFGDWFNGQLDNRWLDFYRALRLVLDSLQSVNPDDLFAAWQLFHPGTQTEGRGP